MNIEEKSNKELCEFLASRIRSERVRKGHTQEAISSLAGISLRTYKRFEWTGRGNISNLIEVLRVFGKLRLIELIQSPSQTPPLGLVDRITTLREQQKSRNRP